MNNNNINSFNLSDYTLEACDLAICRGNMRLNGSPKTFESPELNQWESKVFEKPFGGISDTENRLWQESGFWSHRDLGTYLITHTSQERNFPSRGKNDSITIAVQEAYTVRFAKKLTRGSKDDSDLAFSTKTAEKITPLTIRILQTDRQNAIWCPIDYAYNEEGPGGFYTFKYNLLYENNSAGIREVRRKRFPAIERFNPDNRGTISYISRLHPKFQQALGIESSPQTLTLKLPDSEALVSRFNVFSDGLESGHLGHISIHNSEGIAGDLDYVLAFLKHDGVLSSGTEFIHDWSVHLESMLYAKLMGFYYPFFREIEFDDDFGRDQKINFKLIDDAVFSEITIPKGSELQLDSEGTHFWCDGVQYDINQFKDDLFWADAIRLELLTDLFESRSLGANLSGRIKDISTEAILTSAPNPRDAFCAYQFSPKGTIYELCCDKLVIAQDKDTNQNNISLCQRHQKSLSLCVLKNLAVFDLNYHSPLWKMTHLEKKFFEKILGIFVDTHTPTIRTYQGRLIKGESMIDEQYISSLVEGRQNPNGTEWKEYLDNGFFSDYQQEIPDPAQFVKNFIEKWETLRHEYQKTLHEK